MAKPEKKNIVICVSTILKFLAFSLLLIVVLITCVSNSGTNNADRAKAHPDAITINLCQSDPSNADYWQNERINLWQQPGGISANNQKVIDTLPACNNAKIIIIEQKRIQGIDYVRVQSLLMLSKVGWITKRTLY